MFRYRLAGIMRLKEYSEKLRRDELGKCMMEFNLAVEQENALENEISLFKQKVTRSRQGKIDLNQLALEHDYMRYRKYCLTRQQEVVAERQKEAEEARHRLFEAMKERKALEKLKEKKQEQYLYEQNRIEQALLDDLAVQHLPEAP